jgi:hypothetical protein
VVVVVVVVVVVIVVVVGVVMVGMLLDSGFIGASGAQALPTYLVVKSHIIYR